MSHEPDEPEARAEPEVPASLAAPIEEPAVPPAEVPVAPPVVEPVAVAIDAPVEPPLVEEGGPQLPLAMGEGTASPLPEPPPERPPVEEEPVDQRARLPSILESLLFAADHPLGSIELAELVGEPDVAVVEGALALLGVEWSTRGVQLHAVAGGWQFRTNPSNAVWVQRLVAQKPVRLSRPQLETLAIAAYRQPITRPEIDEIRGVDSGGTLKLLLERALVRILGKKEEPGRPLLYGTTREFLEFFNLRDLKELPTLREFQELSDEHRAQVEALERAAPPGTYEGQLDPVDAPPPPLARVELPEAALDEDLSKIDELIAESDVRAKGAIDKLGAAGESAAIPPPPLKPGPRKQAVVAEAQADVDPDENSEAGDMTSPSDDE